VRIIVAGAGIGGLGVATGLLRDGRDVVVLERASQLESVGAGITLFPNAMGALDRLGATRSCATTSTSSIRYRGGAPGACASFQTTGPKQNGPQTWSRLPHNNNQHERDPTPRHRRSPQTQQHHAVDDGVR
jgi:2-polyprenyl-6-methoxyphenol hydroxylase-like FAD-dependent oxidoreductase